MAPACPCQLCTSNPPASITSTSFVDQHISRAPDSSTNTQPRSAHTRCSTRWSAPARRRGGAAATDASRPLIGAGIGSSEARTARSLEADHLAALKKAVATSRARGRSIGRAAWVGRTARSRPCSCQRRGDVLNDDGRRDVVARRASTGPVHADTKAVALQPGYPARREVGPGYVHGRERPVRRNSSDHRCRPRPT
jgi:hypothetical protein